MPGDDASGEKTEEATPKKREEARKEGQVAYSTEVNTIGLLLVGCSLLLLFGPQLYQALVGVVRRTLTDLLHLELRDPEVLRMLAFMCGKPLGLTFAVVGLLFIAGLVLSLAQVGIHFTSKPLVPKLSRIDPMQGLKRIFGLRGLMRTVFAVVKLTLVVAVAWAVLAEAIRSRMFFNFAVEQRLDDTMALLIGLAFKLIAVLALIAMADFLYQRFQHNKELRMSKQEVKEELKQSDGDPLIKSKIRQVQRQMAMNRMMQEVPSADVVITNPTHVAVALRYDSDHMDAPVVVAKGYDRIAQRIKQIAAENAV
ncbi:MAG: EscU/YscU/HrcU family type III secretion system export apparatus switch protein, partial [Thermodesulfobacteriota bacterium]